MKCMYFPFKMVLLCLSLVLLAACGQGEQPEAGQLSLQAVNFTVNSTDDLSDIDPGNGSCYSAVGTCTLRAAIEETNAMGGPATIKVPAGTYVLTNGTLKITDHLTVLGAKEGSTIVDGNANGSVFRIDSPPHKYIRVPRKHVELHHLIIRNGNAGSGGGIYNNGGAVLLNRSQVTENTAETSAGGILNQNEGIFELVRSTVNHNGDLLNHEPGRGGGIKNSGDSFFIVRKSTINDNEANRYAGIANYGTLTMQNATLSGNRSRIDTGGLMNVGKTILNNVTVTENVATVDYDGSIGGTTGGIQNAEDGRVFIGNSIVAGNMNMSSAAVDCSGEISSVGYNLIEDTTDCTVQGDLTGFLTAQDPLLGPLMNNGGETQTHAIDKNSPARNAANPAAPNGVGTACEPTDQRSVSRGAGLAGRCDMGAYELYGSPGDKVTP